MITIPLNVKSIGDNAFYNCFNLQYIYFLGCTSPEIGNDIFTGSKVTEIKVKQDCKDTVVFTNDLSIIPMVKQSLDDIFYSIDESSGLILFYGEGGMRDDFEDSKQPWVSYRLTLHSVIIENGVTNVGSDMFFYALNSEYGYPTIINARIGKSVTSLGWSIFSGATSLASIVIASSSFKSFGYTLFWGCFSLETIYFYGLNEPEYDTDDTCHNSYYCLTDDYLSCAPFTCQTDSLTTVYVPIDYNGNENTFCEKTVTIKKELHV